MAPRQINLDPEVLAPFEIGAILMAVLTFPNADEAERIQLVSEAWCAKLLMDTEAAEPSRSEELRQALPDYAGLGVREVKQQLRQSTRRFRDRMVAARMARGFFQEAITERPAILPATMARLSLNELSKLVLHESGQSDPENVEKRAWSESRPVIHLAAAFDVLGDFRNPGVKELGYDLQDLETHRAIVDLARAHESVVLADPRFGAGPDDLIRFRWVE